MIHHDTMTRTALDAVASACRVARAVQQDLDRVREITKDDRSPVTVADYAVQAIIALELNRALGETHIVGEEHASTLREDDHAAVRDQVVAAVRHVVPDASEDDVLDAIDACDHDGSGSTYWTLDPVDGTKGFLRGQQYAIALAHLEHGRVTLGVMGAPNLPIDQTASLETPDPDGAIYAAAAGYGTWEYHAGNLDEAPNHVKVLPREAGALIRVCESVEAGHSSQGDTARLLNELGGAGEPARLDSQCKYAVVARGQADAYLRMPTSRTYVEKVWDHAAGMLIAMEAGAIVSDITGAPLDFTCGQRLEKNRGVICTAPELHGPVIETIGRLGIAAPA